MSREPVVPTHVYEPMARHIPVEHYRPTSCQCSHGHGPAPVQQIIVKQADPWLRYVLVGFSAAGIAALLLVGLVMTLVALGGCALCAAVAMKSFRGMFAPKKE